MSDRDGAGAPWLAGKIILLVVAAALAGGAACAYIVSSGQAFSDALQQTPLILAWAALIAALGATSWAGLFPAVTAAAQGWKAISRKNTRFIGATLLVIVLLILFSGWMQPRAYPLEGVTWPLGDEHSPRVMAMSIVILIPPFFSVLAMWLTAAWADENAARAPTPTVIAKHLELRDRLQSLLWFCGTVVGGAVLTTGTLRQSMLDGKYATETTYPPSLVLSYGAFFTFILVISYVPAYLLMQGAGQRLMDAQLTGIDDIEAWKEKREKLSDVLHLNVGLDTSLKDTVAILAPIVAGVLPLALPG